MTLSWDAVNATHVEVETAGRRPATGEVEVLIQTTRTLRLTAVNPFGRTERLSPVLRVIALPRLRPLASPAFPVIDVPAPLAPPSLASLSPMARSADTAPLTIARGLPAWPAPIFPGEGRPR